MAWFTLFLAGLLEIGWAVGLKYTDGFTRPWPTVLTVGSMVLSVALLGSPYAACRSARPTPSGPASARSARSRSASSSSRNPSRQHDSAASG